MAREDFEKYKKFNSNFSEHFLNEDENNLSASYRKHPEKSPVLSSYPNSIKPSTAPTLDQITRNFKKLLSQYLSKGNYKNGIKADQFKEQLNKIMHKNSDGQKMIKNYQNISEILRNANSHFKTTKPKINPVITSNLNLNTKSILPIELLKKINKLSTKFSTKKMPTISPIISTSTPINFPLLYKLKINDTISKSLLEDQSIRQKLGIKPNEHINIVVKKPLDDSLRSDFQVTSIPDESRTNHQQNNKTMQKINDQFSAFKYIDSPTTLSWLSKLKAKLNQVLSSTQLPQDLNILPIENFEKPTRLESSTTNGLKSTETTRVPITQSVNDWTRVLDDKYKQSNQI